MRRHHPDFLAPQRQAATAIEHAMYVIFNLAHLGEGRQKSSRTLADASSHCPL